MVNTVGAKAVVRATTCASTDNDKAQLATHLIRRFLRGPQMTQNEMLSQIGLIEGRQAVIGTLSVVWATKEVGQATKCASTKDGKAQPATNLVRRFFRGPDWVNRRATRGYWKFVAWLGGEGRLAGLSVL